MSKPKFRLQLKKLRAVFRWGKTRHVKRLRLRISRHARLTITLRNFRTQKQNRSKIKKQLVLPLHYLPVREATIEFILYKATVRRFQKKLAPLFSLWHHQKRTGLILITLSVAGLFYFGFELFSPYRIEPPVALQSEVESPPKPTLPKPSKVLPNSVPERLKVNRLAMDMSLVPLGRNGDGTMQTPDNFADVAGWYKEAPTPGERGPAIIAGHVDNIYGPSVFWRLREIVPGDMVSIERADKKTANFKVVAVQQFAQSAFPTEQVYGNLDYAGIRLITCGGTFNTQTQRYDQNTVVFGELVT